jgi:hypothetical protein
LHTWHINSIRKNKPNQNNRKKTEIMTQMTEQAKNILKNMPAQMVGPQFTGREYYNTLNTGIQFSGNAQDWGNEAQTTRNFKFTLNNTGTSADDQIIALCPGPYGAAADIKVPAGTTITAIVADGNIITTQDKVVSCVGSPTSVAIFKDYILNNPTRATKIQIRSNSAEQLQELIQIVKINPFTGMSPEQISPATYLKPENANDKLVNFFLNDFQLDRQTIVYFKLLAGASISITIWPGATANQAAELAVEAAKAKRANLYDHEKNN